ncbi:RNA polymerase sigma-70 factor, ECF subfamily [Amycolatopsis arida]|uniref:RNA polymerase sigma-70 factor, ECF subfamily n=1 Tax=Amycolatopsis arida TaxID=587909 RepID=A0A1I5TYH8_9PSEU|nr:RNA polymerase sigma-70 factor (ECF subfamily) [Amycolatopsis arida]SFP88112.1 RNA polymerase sigma-70 factor, ECF subfamily [Amycolatopsis arida]
METSRRLPSCSGRHAEAVWNHAYRLTGSWATAEDLTSTTFLTAWRRRGDFTLVRDSARPWLYAVVGNLARTHHRSERRFGRVLRHVAHADVEDAHADAVTERLSGEDRLHRVLAAVRRLPRAERQVTELCLLGDLSTADAAAALSVAESTVRAHISRARTRLRTMLEES